MERHALFVVTVRALPCWAQTAVIVAILFVGGVAIVVLCDKWKGVVVGGWAPRRGRGLGMLLLLRNGRGGTQGVRRRWRWWRR